MKVRLIFDGWFCRRAEEAVSMPDTVIEEDIKALFPDVFGLRYDENCSYEILKG